jgi:hypothetical protein
MTMNKKKLIEQHATADAVRRAYAIRALDALLGFQEAGA